MNVSKVQGSCYLCLGFEGSRDRTGPVQNFGVAATISLDETNHAGKIFGRFKVGFERPQLVPSVQAKANQTGVHCLVILGDEFETQTPTSL